jgi:hypothetical protein
LALVSWRLFALLCLLWGFFFFLFFFPEGLEEAESLSKPKLIKVEESFSLSPLSRAQGGFLQDILPAMLLHL